MKHGILDGDAINEVLLQGLEVLADHTMRYVSDLGRVRHVLEELLSHLDVMTSSPTQRSLATDQLMALLSQCNSSQLLCEELNRKVQNMSTKVRLSDLLFSYIYREANSDFFSDCRCVCKCAART
jgi:hypothetical protein